MSISTRPQRHSVLQAKTSRSSTCNTSRCQHRRYAKYGNGPAASTPKDQRGILVLFSVGFTSYSSYRLVCGARRPVVAYPASLQQPQVALITSVVVSHVHRKPPVHHACLNLEMEGWTAKWMVGIVLFTTAQFQALYHTSGKASQRHSDSDSTRGVSDAITSVYYYPLPVTHLYAFFLTPTVLVVHLHRPVTCRAAADPGPC